MFNKKFTSKPFAAVKSSERKRMLSSACKRLGIDDSKLPVATKNIMFPKDLSIAKIELHKGQRGSLLVDSRGKPLWVDFDSVLIPTLYMLWSCPFLLDVVVTPDLTIQFLENGADLMVRGVFEPYPSHLRKGDPVAIVRINSPTVPVAVGTCLVNFDEIDQIQAGKAVSVVSVINDILMQSYIRDKVPVPESLDRSFPTEPESNEPEEAAESTGLSAEKEGEESIGRTSEKTAEKTSEKTSENISEKLKAEDEIDENKDMNECTEELASVSLEDLPTESIDNYLKLGLLQVIKKSTGDAPLQLPITASAISSYMMANLASSHPSVQMKKSSWKKASKFFKAMEKEQLLKCKERNGELMIQSISTAHPLVQEHIIYKPRAQKEKKVDATPPKDKNAGKYVVTKYWKPKNSAAPFFKKLQKDPNTYYSDEDLKNLVHQYLSNGLNKAIAQPKNKKFIKPDDELALALGFKSNQPVQNVERGQLLPMLQHTCTPFHTITPPDGEPSKLLKGGVPSIKLKTEKRTGTKVVTIITGLESFYIEPVLFAEELRVVCAGSSTVGPAKNNPNMSMIQIQGNHIKRISKILEDKGIREAWLDT